VAAQFEAGPTDDHGHHRRDDHADEDPRPGGDAVGDHRHPSAVGPDAEEHRMAEGHLPAITADDVPCLRHGGEKEDEDHDVHAEGVFPQKRHEGQQDEKDGEDEPGPVFFEHAISLPGVHQPKIPFGRRNTTAR